MPDPATRSLESRADYVRGMFNRIAGRYDLVNDLMTVGRHRAWKRQLVRLAGIRPGDHVLDLCTGTGDLAVLAAQVVGPYGRVTAVDFSAEMLARAQQRHGLGIGTGPSTESRFAGGNGAPRCRVDWQQGDALDLAFADGTFDAALVGFGLRNVADLDRVLREMHRVLRPRGVFGSLDLGKPRNGLIRKASDFYSFRAVPLLASMAGAPRDAYQYLPESNLAFPDQGQLAGRLESAGFQSVRILDRALGAIALLTARTPG